MNIQALNFIFSEENSLNVDHYDFDCATVDQKVYAIAGRMMNGCTKKIEILDFYQGIDNVSSLSWRLMGKNLPSNAQYPFAMRAVVYGDDIIVLMTQELMTIHTRTETVSRMAPGSIFTLYSGMLIVYPYIWSFGNNDKNRIQYLTLNTRIQKKINPYWKPINIYPSATGEGVMKTVNF